MKYLAICIALGVLGLVAGFVHESGSKRTLANIHSHFAGVLHSTHALAMFEPTDLPTNSPTDDAALLAKGRTIFNNQCSKCHGVDGQNPAETKLDFRLKKSLTYEKIYKATLLRLKNEDDSRATATFIKKLTESK
jgi:hypothetical protein